MQELVDAILAIMEARSMSMRALLDRLLAASDAGMRVDRELADLLSMMDDAERFFVGAISAAISRGFDSTFLPALSRLALADLVRTGKVDVKTVNVLIERAVSGYRRANRAGKASVEAYFRIVSSSGPMTEADVYEALARGLIDRQSARESIKLLSARIARTRQVLDAESLKRFQSRVMRDFKRELARNPNLSEALRAAHLAKKRATLEDGKLLQIVDKNGKVRTYRIETYSATVAETEIGNAQVEGELQAGESFGVRTFTVTAHNTPTEICKPHENRTYTTARRGPLRARYEYLTPERRPLYHRRCRHRLTADPLAEENVA